VHEAAPLRQQLPDGVGEVGAVVGVGDFPQALTDHRLAGTSCDGAVSVVDKGDAAVEVGFEQAHHALVGHGFEALLLFEASSGLSLGVECQPGPALLGDVLHHGQKTGGLALGHGHAGLVDMHPHHGPIGMNVALVAQEAGDQALAQLGLVLDFMGEVIGVGQVHPVLSPQRITRAAGQIGEALIEVDDAVGGRVDHHDAQV